MTSRKQARLQRVNDGEDMAAQGYTSSAQVAGVTKARADRGRRNHYCATLHTEASFYTPKWVVCGRFGPSDNSHRCSNRSRLIHLTPVISLASRAIRLWARGSNLTLQGFRLLRALRLLPRAPAVTARLLGTSGVWGVLSRWSLRRYGHSGHHARAILGETFRLKAPIAPSLPDRPSPRPTIAPLSEPHTLSEHIH
jgi:hypothetical protein